MQPPPPPPVAPVINYFKKTHGWRQAQHDPRSGAEKKARRVMLAAAIQTRLFNPVRNSRVNFTSSHDKKKNTAEGDPGNEPKQNKKSIVCQGYTGEGNKRRACVRPCLMKTPPRRLLTLPPLAAANSPRANQALRLREQVVPNASSALLPFCIWLKEARASKYL